MLKINDNLDLEKIGFKKGYNGYFQFKIDSNRIRVFIDPDNKEVDRTIYSDDCMNNTDYYGTLDMLFDLIKAGLVKKV